MKWPTLIALGLVLVALVMWDQHLRKEQSQTRRQSARISQLLPESPFEQYRVAGIRVDVAQRDVFLYVLQEGVWRCATSYGAPAQSEPLEALVPALLQASGVIRSTDPADAASFGFNDENALRLSFNGPDLFTHPTGDTIYALDIGHSIHSTGGSYVRPVNTDEIWAIDTDFRELLQLEPGKPPMLDPHIVPQAWPGVRLGPARIIIERAGQPIITIVRQSPQDDRAAEGMQWEWIVRQDEEAFIGDLFQVTSYAVFLTRAPYAGILAPRPLDQVGLVNPQAVITYETEEGPQLQLLIGGPGPRGGAVVLNTHTQVLYEVDPAIVARMLPELDMLLTREQGNPWEQWMRR